MWGLTSSGDKGVAGGRNQSPSLVSGILVGGEDGSSEGRLVIYKGIGEINN